MSHKELSILDVGHGNCAFLQDENGCIVIDAGPGSTLLEFLLAENIKKIDVVLISHADKDHIEGLVALLNSNVIEIGRIRLNSDSEKESRLWNDLLIALDDLNEKGRIDFDIGLTTKNSGEFDQGSIHIEILAPSLYIAGKSVGSTDKKGRTLNSNSNSVVIRLKLNEKPLVLLPADVDNIGFDNLIEDKPDCAAPVVVFPHHGGNPGVGNAVKFTESFCQITQPSILIFSLGRGVHGTPRPEIIEAIKRSAPEARIMCTQLSENCAAALPTVERTHLTNKFSRGKQKNHCCAGTITINLDDIEQSTSEGMEGHKNFIKAIPGALCMLRIPVNLKEDSASVSAQR